MECPERSGPFDSLFREPAFVWVVLYMPRRKKGAKKPKAFTYGAKNNANHYGYLNFIQTQAHNLQVDALLREVNQAQAFTKRAVKEALDSVYDNSGPMDVDPPLRIPRPPPLPQNSRMTRAPPNRGEFPLRFSQDIRRTAAQNNLMRRNRVARETPTTMEGITATLSRTAPPATVEAVHGMAGPSGHVAHVTNPHPVYRTVTGGVYPPVPTAEELATRVSYAEVRAARRQAARAGASVNDMSGLAATLLMEDPHGTIRRADRAPSVVPLPQRQRNTATDTYNAMVGSTFQHAPRQDTMLEYNPITRDNKARRVPAGSASSTPLGQDSRFANVPHGP